MKLIKFLNERKVTGTHHSCNACKNWDKNKKQCKFPEWVKPTGKYVFKDTLDWQYKKNKCPFYESYMPFSESLNEYNMDTDPNPDQWESDGITRAGLMPYYIDENNETQICLMIPSDPAYGGSKPQIAKGHVDKGETPEKTAIREAEEELGYIHKSHYKVNYVTTMSNIRFYAVKVDSKNFNPASWETGEVIWIREKDLHGVREWQKPIIKRIFDAVK